MIFIILSLLNIADATKGIDLSAAFNDFACVKNSGYSFAIVRGYMSYGAVDQTGLTNLRRAKAAGLIGDAYFFPCMGKVSVNTQVTDFVNAFGSEFGTVWVDVEINPSTNCGWTKYIHSKIRDINANCAFLDQIVQRLKDYKKLVGIYSSAYMWETIFGNRANCPYFTDLPLWYAHYDNNPSFSDYATYKIGGWTKPSIKQYTGDTTLCGVGVDLNYY